MNRSRPPVAGIILAAGTATRMGKTKQLLAFEGTTLLGRVIQNAMASELDDIIVVLGHEASQICKSLDLSGVRIVKNRDYSNGQSTSLLQGLAAVPDHCDAAMFLLGDQPLVTPAIINRLIDAFMAEKSPIIIPYCNKKRGNPVIIARPLFAHLESITADTGARAIFDRFEKDILKLDIDDDAVLFDVDTPGDYENLLSRPHSDE